MCKVVPHFVKYGFMFRGETMKETKKLCADILHRAQF